MGKVYSKFRCFSKLHLSFGGICDYGSKRPVGKVISLLQAEDIDSAYFNNGGRFS